MGTNDDNLPSPPPLDPGPGSDVQIQSPDGGEPTSVDDGLDDSERAIFESMRTGAEPPAPSIEDPARKPAVKTPAVAAEGDADGEGDADDDGDSDSDGDGDGGEGADGQQQTGEQRRINFQKHKRILQKKDAELEQLRAKLQEQAIRDAKLNERLAILDEALRTPAAPKNGEGEQDDPEPPEDDVFATVAWQKRQIARLAKQVNEVTSGVAQSQQATHAEQSFRTYYSQDVSAVRAEDPNFDEAYAFLMMSRDRELQAIGYVDQAMRHEMIRKDERAIVTKAMDEWRKTGVPTSAAKRLMSLAIARGYKPGVLSQGQQQGGDPAPAPGANGGAAPAPAGGQKPGGRAPAPAPAPRPSVADEVKNLREAREANQSLSDGGGDSVRTLTTETLLKLDDDEFGDLVDNLPRDKLMALAGR